MATLNPVTICTEDASGNPEAVGKDGVSVPVTSPTTNVTQAQFNVLSPTSADEDTTWKITDGANAGNLYEYAGVGVTPRLMQVWGAAKVMPFAAPMTQMRGRWLTDVTTRKKVEWPSGADITYLSVYATIAAGVTVATTTTTTGSELAACWAALTIDAGNDAEASANLVISADQAASDVQFIPIPLNEWVTIPLSTALVNGTLGGGRIDVISASGDALDIFIGGQ